MDIHAYIKAINRQFNTSLATEHTHRPALQALLESAMPGVLVTNEPKQLDCGAPDYVLTRNQIPLGYIEAKDIGKNLDDASYKAQLKRYSKALDNLIVTNYLEFRRFKDGKPEGAGITIATLSGGCIKPKQGNFGAFADFLKNFARYEGQTITSAADLARRMALKARLLAGEIRNVLWEEDDTTDEVHEARNTLHSQLTAFRENLIHEITVGDFADIYAQTVAYGMFAARLHDHIPATFSRQTATFSRQKAAELIPVTNPFLRKFFQHIAGFDLDERIRWIVDDLADIFRAADVGELMKDYGKSSRRNDPFIHFYETFLGEYDPKLRKSRGVYYTPEPVVNFIVRAVDKILRTDFGLKDGLANTSRTTMDPNGRWVKTSRQSSAIKKEVHKVQILDPATGTGTFLAHIVQHIHDVRFRRQKGAWSDYVKNELIPRLNGFEVLMTSYAMAHTKLEMVLKETGYELGTDRLRIFLTNSLEERHRYTRALFATWLVAEAREANDIKRNTPVMVVIGNPPYSGESANKGDWIMTLLKKYKEEPGGGKLRERNPKWINDDYVKFILYGQHYIDRTGEGILAYINNHSFLDNPTFRGMRWSLLHSFDAIYILDLHGNSKKKETAPNGSPDKNIFDIQQGVSINLFVKTGKKSQNELGQVFHYDLYGQRETKYQFLLENNLEQIRFKELKPQAPQYFFVPKDHSLQAEYDKGIAVNHLLPVNSVGIVTARDDFTIHHTPNALKATVTKFLTMDDETARQKFSLGQDVEDWEVALARTDLKNKVFGNDNDKAVSIHYRPFDIQYTYYTGTSKGFHCRPRVKVMHHFIAGDNIGLTLCKQFKGSEKYCHVFIAGQIFESSLVSNKTGEIGYGFPLYLYPDTKQQNLYPDAKQQSFKEQQKRKPNLDSNIVQTIADVLGMRFTHEKKNDNKTFAPVDLLDYVYAVLHSLSYRDRYKEFLKTDFPKVPYPTDKKLFRKLVALGGKLRILHLMESPALDTLITTYPETGDNVVTRSLGKDDYEITDTRKRLGKVWINKKQYFGDVPEIAWNFYIGSYQPAQKWLKDRKGRKLTHQAITHYQKIIVALTETNRLMQAIDKLPLCWHRIL